MCGFAGFWHPANLPENPGQLLKTMGNQIAHRGPDDSGIFIHEKAGLGLVHRRLSIVDLSAAGHQPMASVSGRYTLVYNGEIYNHLAIRTELEKIRSINWRGHSDTETLLAAIEAWGLKSALQRALGMFALALWDEQQQSLQLARDRVGEKPLYYGWQNGHFLFASELKALKVHPAFAGNVHPPAISLLLRHGYIAAPHCIYQDMAKLLPASILTLHKGAVEPHLQNYWQPDSSASSFQADSNSSEPNRMVEQLHGLLKQAVGRQMVADVPLGAFLSGGIDSSLIVSLMQAQSARPVKTFTIGFEEQGFNEADYARQVAEHLGTEHTELYVPAAQAREVIPLLPAMYDEPFADSSQIPTYLVAKLARQHVTVALSGDGGDELFYGYSRYLLAMNYWGKMQSMPTGLRKLAGRTIQAIPESTWDWLGRLKTSTDSQGKPLHWGHKITKAASLMQCDNLTQLYRLQVSKTLNPSSLLRLHKDEEPDTLLNQPGDLLSLDGPDCLMALDRHTYLPDDVLAKVDRAAMAVSLETRVPMLDHTVAEYALSMPHSFKALKGKGKWPLRQILSQYVPDSLFERPKMGFGVPVHHWLTGPLRDWAEHLLEPNRMTADGYFNTDAVQGLWQQQLSGQANRSDLLWTILMFQAWLYEK